MAVLATKTLEAIYAAYEAAQDDGFRAHLGASIIGRECPRQLWYAFHWATAVRHDGRLLRLFETGQLAEDRFEANLKAIGVNIMTIDPGTGNQFRVVDHGGHFGGSMDGAAVGFPEDPETWMVVEMKTHGEKSFKQLVANGVEESKPEHYAQMQCYMGKTGMTKAFYVAVKKNTDDLYCEFIDFDQAKFDNLMTKAHTIIASDRPVERISNDEANWKCKLCDHNQLCHNDRAPEVNCRTCAHSTPIIDDSDAGVWRCELNHQPIPVDFQRRGCADHVYNPMLISHWAEPVAGNADGTAVQYRHVGTSNLFWNGAEGYTSKEIHALQDKRLLGEEGVDAIKQRFGAEVMA